MGAKLTKSKTLTISGKTKEQQIDTTATLENTNNHHDLSTNTDEKQTVKTKKKKEEKSSKKSSKTKVDKSTNTENCVLPSSSFTEQLVGEQITPVTNPVSLDINTVQTNAAHLSELPNKDVQELQDSYVENGIVSSESHSDIQQANNLNIAEEAVNNVPLSVVTNSDAVHYEDQQAQLVES